MTVARTFKIDGIAHCNRESLISPLPETASSTAKKPESPDER